MQNTLRDSGLAACCLIHGNEGECHESLVERLAYLVERIAQRKDGRERPPVKITKIPWQYEGSLEARLQRLVAWLFERFWAGRELRLEDTSPRTLGELFASSFSSVVFLQHDIRAARWDHLSKSLIKSYFRYLSEMPNDSKKPQVIAFLNVIYPSRPYNEWPKLLFNLKALREKVTKAKIQRELLEIQRRQPALQGEKLPPCLLLDELKPITRDDVLEWLSLHNIFETEEQRIRAAGTIFTCTDSVAPWKSMAEVETHLRQLQRRFLVERGFV
jgi:hypothetical protein